MKTRSTVPFFLILALGIAWTAQLAYSRNLLWFFVPATFMAVIWIALNRKDLRFYIHPKSAQANQNGVKCLRLGQYEKANLFFNEAIRLYPQNAQAFSNRGLVNINLGQVENAIADATKAIQFMPNLANSYSVRALASLRTKNYDGALNDCKRSIQLNPKFAFAYQVRGSVWVAKDDFDSAIKDFTYAIQLMSNSKKHRAKAVAYCDLASAYWKQGKSSEAISSMDTAINLDSKLAYAFNNRGYFHSCLGNLDNALDDCNRAIVLNPQLYAAYGSRGHTHFLRHEYADALADFEKSRDLKPNHEFALAGEAISRAALGNKQEALALWQSLIELNASYKEVDKLAKDYQPAIVFVEAARELAKNLDS